MEILIERLAVVTTAYTGIMLCKDFSAFHKYVEELLERPVWTHELGNATLWKQLKEKSKPELMELWGLEV